MRAVLVGLALAGILGGGTVAEAGETEHSKLENGLTVILRPIEGSPTAALVVLYSVGSDGDLDGRSGLAHLVEHVYVTAAAGKTPARTAQAFFQRYTRGANAQTGEDYTVVATVFLKGKMEEEIKEAATRMGGLRVEATDLEREKARLLQEISNMFGGIPALGARNLAGECVRPTPLGGRKGGVPEEVQAITLGEIRNRLRRYYKPRNAVLVLAGGFETDPALKSIREAFGPIPSGEEAPKPHSPGKPRLGEVEEVRVKPLQVGAPSFACAAYPAPSPRDDLYAAFLVLVKRFWYARDPEKPWPPPLSFAPLDDPSKAYLVLELREGESAEGVAGRLERLMAETVGRGLGEDEIQEVMTYFSLFFWPDSFAEAILAGNPYGVAFALGRVRQLGIDVEAIERALRGLDEDDLRRAAREIFGPDRRAVVIAWTGD